MISSVRSTIAAIVPVRDRAAELERALRSVLVQRHPVDEVVVVDDASVEPVDLSWWPAGAPSLKLIRNPLALGSGGARNVGVAASSCEWVAFLDSDDQWLPGHIDLVLDAAPRAAVVVTGYRAVYEQGGRHHDVLPNLAHNAHRRLLRLYNQPVSCTTTAVAVDWFAKVEGFRQETAPLEDYDLILRIAEHGELVSVRSVTAVKESGRADRVYSVARDSRVVPVLMELHSAALAADRVAAGRFSLRRRMRSDQADGTASAWSPMVQLRRLRLGLPRRLTALGDRLR